MLLTVEGQRLIYLPRPFRTKNEVEVFVNDRTTKSTTRVEWAPQKAYVLEPNTWITTNGGPIRFFCISFRYGKPEGDKDREEDEV